MRIFITITLFVFIFKLKSQNTEKDTANYPYWIKMMEDNSIKLSNTQSAFYKYWENREITKGCGYKVFKRWEYIAKLHLNAEGFIQLPKPYNYQKSNIPDKDIWNISVSNLSTFDSVNCFSDTQWIEMGPKNLNDIGRINCIAFHPTDSNTMLCGSASGGLWKTIDGGLNWYLFLDSLPTLGVASIAFDNDNPLIIYLGTGDKENDAIGNGIYKSIDGGISWNPINNGISQNTVVQKIIIDKNNSEILLIATKTGIYRTINAGKNWKKCYNFNYYFNNEIEDIVFKPNSSKVVYLTSSGIFYKSIDSGKVFKEMMKGINYGYYYCNIAVTENDSNYVYFLACNQFNFGGLFKSTNSGDSFTLMSSTPNIMGYQSNGSDASGGQAWYCKDIVVNPKNKNEIYVGGINVFKSTNGGASWQINSHWNGNNAPYVHADVHSLEYNYQNTLFSTNDGGVYCFKKSKWNNYSKGLGVRQTYRVSISLLGLINAGFQDNGSANNWSIDSKLFSNSSGGDGMDNALDSNNNRYTSVQYGTIYKNGNIIAGTNINGISESGDWITPFVLQENNHKIMIAGYQNLWKSTNLNNEINVNFTNICNGNALSTSSFINDIENSPVDNNILYFSRNNGDFFKCSNINSLIPKWTNLTSNKPLNLTVKDIQCDYFDTSILYIALGDNIYKSNNSGNTWNIISNGLPNVVPYCLTIDSSRNNPGLFCGTSSGVYFYSFYSNKWKVFKSNFPQNVKVLDMDINYNKKMKSYNRLIVGTYGRGIWSSTLASFEDSKPIARFGTYNYNKNREFYQRSICKNGSIPFVDSSLGLNLKHLWQVFPNKGISYLNDDSISKNTRIIFNEPGIYNIRKIVANCLGYDTFVMKGIYVYDTMVRKYCFSKNTSSFPGLYGNEYFNINGYGLSSGTVYEKGEYEDLTCKEIFYVNANSNYSISLNVSNFLKEYVKIYIDYNNDGRFNEKNELLKSFSGKNFLTENITISNNSVKNKLLRLRIVTDIYPIDSSTCVNLDNGQTEDYSIVIEDFYAKILSSTDTACINQKISFSDSSKLDFKTYEWDFGKDAIPQFSNEKNPQNIKYISSGYKTVLLTTNNKFTTTIINKIYIKPKYNYSLNIQNNDYSLCVNDTLKLLSNIDISQNNLINWYKDGMLLTNQNINFIKPNVLLSDSGKYFFTTSNICYSDTSNFIDLNIFTLPNAEFNILKLNNYDYTFTPVNLNYNNYNWNFGDNSTSIVNQPFHTYSKSGTFKIVLIANSNSCMDSSYKILKIEDKNNIHSIIGNTLKISPNPFKYNIQIQFSSNINSTLEISLHHLDGKFIKVLLLKDIVSGNFNQIFNLSDISNGNYFIKLKIGNRYETAKIIKME